MQASEYRTAYLCHGGANTIRAIGVRNRCIAFSAQVAGDRRRERAAGNGNRLSGVVESRLLLGRGIPGVGLDGRVIALRREGTTGDGDLAKALVAGAVDDGNRRAVLDGAVVLGLLNRVA